MTGQHQEPPERILSSAAGIENLLTWIVVGRAARDQFGFHLLMTYAADRIPIAEKIKMFGEIVDSLSDKMDGVAYPELLDDLRIINRVRVHVAHAIDFSTIGGPRDEGSGYVMFRRGLPRRVSAEELQQQVSEAAEKVSKVLAVMIKVADATDLMNLPVYGEIANG